MDLGLPRTVKIIFEESSNENLSCRALLKSLKKSLKERNLSFEVCGEIQDSYKNDATFIIGFSRQWINNTIIKINSYNGIPIILSAYQEHSYEGRYHLLCPNMERVCDELKNKLKESGRHRIAIYGIDPGSSTDKSRLQSLESLSISLENVYTNSSGLDNCFRIFQKNAGEYDVVICTNGYAAVSLTKKLLREQESILEHLAIISFEEVLRHSKYSQYISNIHLKLENYGQVAVAISKMKILEENIDCMMMKMNCEVDEIIPQDCSREKTVDDSFYVDSEVVRIAKVEQLLQEADDLDHHIIAVLLSNKTYAEIADTCYLSERNVRYRVKKYMDICNCKSKKELLELLKEYLQ